MAYVKETLSQDQGEVLHKKYGFVNPISDRAVIPLQWAVNKETGSFIVGIGGGMGYRADRTGKGDRTPVYCAFVWRDAGCKVIYSWDTDVTGHYITIKVETLVVPELVLDKLDDLVKDMTEAILSYFGTHPDHEYHLISHVQTSDSSLISVGLETGGKQYVW